MDNERRRFIKGGLAIGLLMGGGALIWEGSRNIKAFKEKADPQDAEARRRILEEGKPLTVQGITAELNEIQTKDGNPQPQGWVGLGELTAGFGAGATGTGLVCNLAETEKAPTPTPSNTGK